MKTMLAALLYLVVAINVKSGHGANIIGGKEVQPHSLPFMAFLITSKGFCGGNLISADWVLTAAHCLPIQKVCLGLHSIENLQLDCSKQERGVARLVVHPNYSNDTYFNDLMLVKLDTPAVKTKKVKWLTLGESGKYPEVGLKCLVAGWGVTNFNHKYPSNVLLSATVSVIDRVTCNSPEYYGGMYVITEGMICAGSTGDDHSDSCKGDSGGPLLCNDSLVGITSFGENCGLPDKPGVYAHLSKERLQWIQKTMYNEVQ